MKNDVLIEAFEALVRARPEATLVVSAGRTTSAGDVARLARGIEDRLRESEVTAGSVVGLAAPNGPGFLAALVALRRSMCTVLLLEPQGPPRETRSVLARFAAAALLRAPAWPDGPAACELRRLQASPDDDRAGDETRAVRAPAGPTRVDPIAIAVIKQTSGTTGSARGVATSAEALLADDAALRASMGIRAADRLLAAVPFSHSYGLSSLVVPALVAGLPLVLPNGVGGFALLEAAHAASATVLPTVPAWLGGLSRLAEPPCLPASLRLVISAGAPLAPATATAFRARCGRAVHVFYGASECGGITYDREGTAGERGTLGAPVEGVQVELDAVRDDAPAARVVVRSPAVAAGYWPDPDPRLAGGCFRSQDLARWEGAELRLVGRLDERINLRGHKIDPAEVERTIAALVPVEEVRVLAAADSAGEPVLRAVVACRPGSLTAGQVASWCRAHLSPHKVPRSIVLVGDLPRNARGKVDRAALEHLAE